MLSQRCSWGLRFPGIDADLICNTSQTFRSSDFATSINNYSSTRPRIFKERSTQWMMCVYWNLASTNGTTPMNAASVPLIFSPLRIERGQPSCRSFSSSKISWISCIDSEIMMLEIIRNSSTMFMMSFVAVRQFQTRGCLCSRTFHLGDVNSWFKDNVQFRSSVNLPKLLMKLSWD